MAASKRRRSDRALRPAMCSPGRPTVGRREHRQRFWEEVARGVSSAAAAVAAGVSPAVGARWFRQMWGHVTSQFPSLVEALPIVRRSRRDCGSSSPRLWRTRDRPGSCAAHRRRSLENCDGTQPHEVETSSIGPRPPNGMPINERRVFSLLLEHQQNCPLPRLWGVLLHLFHPSILSTDEVSGKPGAIHSGGIAPVN